MVCENQLGPPAKHATTSECEEDINIARVTLVHLQIVPSVSSWQDAMNSRNLKESHSLHLEEQIECYGEDETGELFGQFSSVTLQYDGD